MKIFSSLLLLISAVLSIKHGWDGLHIDSHPEQAKMAVEMGATKAVIIGMSILNLALGVALLFPRTFFLANLVHACVIVLIIGFALRAGNYRMALIEIPFLLLPLVLIYLGHPLKK